MATKFKLKYLIIAFIIISVITACTAFSVSYAAWIAPQKSSVDVSISTGDWNVSDDIGGIDFKYADGTSGDFIKFNNNNANIVEYDDKKDYSEIYFVVLVNEGQKISITVRGNTVAPSTEIKVYDFTLETAAPNTNLITRSGSSEFLFNSGGYYYFKLYCSSPNYFAYDIDKISDNNGENNVGTETIDLRGINNGVKFGFNGGNYLVDIDKFNINFGISQNEMKVGLRVKSGQSLSLNYNGKLFNAQNYPELVTFTDSTKFDFDPESGIFTFKSDSQEPFDILIWIMPNRGGDKVYIEYRVERYIDISGVRGDIPFIHSQDSSDFDAIWDSAANSWVKAVWDGTNWNKIS